VQTDLNETFKRNSGLPVNVKEVEVLGAGDARDSFLNHQVAELFEPRMDLEGFVNSLESVADKFRYLGMYDSIKYHVEMLPDSVLDKSLDLKTTLHLNRIQKQAVKIETLTRNGEQAGITAQATLDNVFGGAESVTVFGGYDWPPNQVAGLRLKAPIVNSPKFGWSLTTDWRSMDLPWASHSQDLSTASLRLLIANILKGDASVGLQASLRDVHNLKSAASDSVRVDSGQSLKTSLVADWSIDTSNHAFYPTSGVKLAANAEYALPNPSLQSNVSFVRALAKGSVAKTLDPIKDRLVFEVTGGAGLLWSKNSSILDRFYLGGPKSGLYGYQNNGLGPKDLDDAIGGDGYIKGSLNIYGKLPRLSVDSPLRFMLFFNGATLTPIDVTSQQPLKPMFENPSTGAGVGLCYRTEAAQLELTYSVPLSTKPHDITRKGLQFCVGIALP
jgi:outer membrane protein insertion porin family